MPVIRPKQHPGKLVISVERESEVLGIDPFMWNIGDKLYELGPDEDHRVKVSFPVVPGADPSPIKAWKWQIKRKGETQPSTAVCVYELPPLEGEEGIAWAVQVAERRDDEWRKNFALEPQWQKMLAVEFDGFKEK